MNTLPSISSAAGVSRVANTCTPVWADGDTRRSGARSTAAAGASGGEVRPSIQAQTEEDVQGHRVTVPATSSDLERGVAGLDVHAGEPSAQAGRHDQDVPAAVDTDASPLVPSHVPAHDVGATVSRRRCRAVPAAGWVRRPPTASPRRRPPPSGLSAALRPAPPVPRPRSGTRRSPAPGGDGRRPGLRVRSPGSSVDHRSGSIRAHPSVTLYVRHPAIGRGSRETRGRHRVSKGRRSSLPTGLSPGGRRR